MCFSLLQVTCFLSLISDYKVKCFGILIKEHSNIRRASEANLLGIIKILES